MRRCVTPFDVSLNLARSTSERLRACVQMRSACSSFRGSIRESQCGGLCQYWHQSAAQCIEGLLAISGGMTLPHDHDEDHDHEKSIKLTVCILTYERNVWNREACSHCISGLANRPNSQSSITFLESCVQAASHFCWALQVCPAHMISQGASHCWPHAKHSI